MTSTRRILLALPVLFFCVGVAKAQSAQPTKYATIEVGENERVGSLSFSPDGERLGYRVSVNRVETWDVKTKKPLQQVYKAEKEKFLLDADFSPDWMSLAVTETTDVVQVDVRTGRRTVLYTHPSREADWDLAWFVRYTPDGKRIVSAGMDGVLKVWDVAKKDSVAQFPFVRKGQAFRTGGVHDVVPVPGTDTAFVCVTEQSPEKRQMADSTDKLLLADLKAGTVKTVIDDVDFFPAGSTGSAASRDGKLFAMGHGAKVLVLSTATLKAEPDLVCPLDYVVCLFSDSGRLLIVGGQTPGMPPPFEHMEGEVAIYDRETKKWLTRFRVLDRGVASMALSPKGNLLAVASGKPGTITVWDLSPLMAKLSKEKKDEQPPGKRP